MACSIKLPRYIVRVYPNDVDEFFKQHIACLVCYPGTLPACCEGFCSHGSEEFQNGSRQYLGSWLT